MSIMILVCKCCLVAIVAWSSWKGEPFICGPLSRFLLFHCLELFIYFLKVSTNKIDLTFDLMFVCIQWTDLYMGTDTVLS